MPSKKHRPEEIIGKLPEAEVAHLFAASAIGKHRLRSSQANLCAKCRAFQPPGLIKPKHRS